MPLDSPPRCEEPRGLTDAAAASAALAARDERLRALNRLVGKLTHDFNNSLTPLVGYVSLLEAIVPTQSPGGQYLAKMHLALRRTRDFMSAAMEATHPERRFTPTDLDLSALLLREVESWVKALPVDSGISVVTDVAPCSLCLDQHQWTQAIKQLLRNAQAALAEGGTLKVTLQRRLPAPHLDGRPAQADDDGFELIFADTGCGMAPDVLARACDPLFTTGWPLAVHGLGLTLVHSVVRVHGGQLWIDSAEGAGTRITIRLPSRQT